MDPPPPGAPRPSLKLKISVPPSRTNSFSGASAATPVATPLSTPGGDSSKKIIIKSSQKSQPPTPVAPEAPTPVSTTTKAGRKTKPTKKVKEANKRPAEDDELDTPSGKKKIKIKTLKSATPTDKLIVFKPKTGKNPYHPPGDGYDSEASDRELDPAIEEQIIFRMMPGDDCDYLQSCIQQGKMGKPRSEGGADVVLKFFEEDSRRAIFTVRGQPYAAVLLDLPTIIETMKTWDKKALVKSADICQMLLVFQKVPSEEEAKAAELPSGIQLGFKWPHGLTPPMHDCVNRRFAKTISRKEIEDKEAEVERLLLADRAASVSKWEWVDDRRQRGLAQETDDDEEDADGEMEDSGYFPPGAYEDAAGEGQDEGEEDEVDDDLEAQLLQELLQSQAEGESAMNTQGDGATPAEAETPAPEKRSDANGAESVSDEDDDEDDDDDDDDDDEGRSGGGEEADREEIADLRKQIKEMEDKAKKEISPILRRRLEEKLKTIRVELQLRLAHMGGGEEDDEEDE